MTTSNTTSNTTSLTRRSLFALGGLTAAPWLSVDA